MDVGGVDNQRIVRLCGAPDCNNPVGEDNRRRYCSKVCAVKVNRENALRRGRALRGLGQSDRVCAAKGCQRLVRPPRRLYCSDACAGKMQREQVRKGCEITRKKRRSSSKSKARRSRELRTIRGMQQVPVERWPEYEFVRS